MPNRDWLKVPESDYQSDEPTVNPVEVRLMYDDPLEKEMQRTDGSGSFKSWLYAVENQADNVEYTWSASKHLHEEVQKLGATKDMIVKIIKKRIGPGQKDIRWSVGYIGGPVDHQKQNALQGNGQAQSTQTQPAKTQKAAPQQQPAGSSVYLPTRRNEEYMRLLREIAADKLENWSTIYALVQAQFPDESSDWAATRATHLHIDVNRMVEGAFRGGTRAQEGAEAVNEREEAILSVVRAGLPDTLFGAIADNHEHIEDAKVAAEIVKMFGYQAVPKKDQEIHLSMARKAWRYTDRRHQGFEVAAALEATADEFGVPHEVLKAPEDEPPF